MLNWDTRVALAYAAEELFLTAQALTTDLISREQGLLEAHDHVRALLQHERYLPMRIGIRLHHLNDSYARREDSRAQDRAGADLLTANTLSVLNDIRDVLAEYEPLPSHKTA